MEEEGIWKRTLAIWWHAMRGQRWLFWCITGAIILAETVSTLAPWALKYLFDTLEQHKEGAWEAAILFAWLFVLARGVTLSIWQGIGTMINRFQPRTIAQLEQDAFQYIIQHSPGFFSHQFSGSLVKRIGRLGRSFETIHDEFSFKFLSIFTMVVVGSASLFSRSPLLGGTYLLWVGIVITMNVLFLRWTVSADKKRNELDSRMGGVLADAFSNMSTIHAFAGEKTEVARMRSVSNQLAVSQTRSWDRHQFIRTFQEWLGVCLDIGVLFIGLHLWRQGIVTVGDLIFVQLVAIQFFLKVRDIGRGLRGVSEAFANSAESVTLMELAHEVQDVKGAKKLVVSRGEIRFDQVAFAYGESKPILRACDFIVHAKEKVALIGPSGAGKSTVVKLLLRAYDISQGAICIDGQNIAQVRQESLRQEVAFVPQEPSLFHRSLLENIRYGNSEASRKEVERAARQARCHEFICRLPQGYDTLVGERGVKLSGGERQRVAIARAILKGSPILILDEATAALDSESEALIQEALQELMKKKTVLVIAHRLSTIMSMDRILVMKDGKVVDDGTHEDLISRDGLYRHLWEIQAGGFLGE